MGESEHRQIARDSLFVMAEVRFDGVADEHKVRVRNLSAGGLMAEGDFVPTRGQLVSIKIRNVGWTEGAVAWIEGRRFGIAFRDEIDPKVARAPVVAAGEGPPRFTRPPIHGAPDAKTLRKI